MNCSRKFNDRYKPEPQAPMNPHRITLCITVCLETLLVIALVVTTVLVALLIAAPI